MQENRTVHPPASMGVIRRALGVALLLSTSALAAQDPEQLLDQLSLAVEGAGAEAVELEWRQEGQAPLHYRLELVVDGPASFAYELHAPTPTGAATVFSEGGEVREPLPGGALRVLETPFEPLRTLFGDPVDRVLPRLAWAAGVWPPPKADHGEVRKEKCDPGPCRRLVFTWQASGIQLEYLLQLPDEGEPVLLEARVGSGLRGDDFARSAAEAGLPPAPRWGGQSQERWLTARFQTPSLAKIGEPLDQDSLWGDGGWVEADSEGNQGFDGTVFYDRMDVRLFSFKVRPVDRQGEVVKGLTVEDFRARVGRDSAEVVAVDWIPPEGALANVTAEELEELKAAGIPVEHGRQVVFFLHTSLYSHRYVGLWLLMKRIDEVLDQLHPHDRLAVVSFDSHLKMRLDFTEDRRAIVEALQRGVRRHPDERVKPNRQGPSLVRHLAEPDAMDAAFVEDGIRLTAEALAKVPGEKIILLATWGLGAEHGGHLTPRYRRMMEVLLRSNIPVSSLFVSSWAGSTLQPSVASIASHSGGTFASLYGHGPDRALRRFGNALDGHYRVTLQAPDRKRSGAVMIDVDGPRRKEAHRVFYGAVGIRGNKDLGR